MGHGASWQHNRAATHILTAEARGGGALLMSCKQLEHCHKLGNVPASLLVRAGTTYAARADPNC